RRGKAPILWREDAVGGHSSAAVTDRYLRRLGAGERWSSIDSGAGSFEGLVSRRRLTRQASDLPFGGIEESGTSVFRMRGMVGGTSPPEPSDRISATEGGQR